MDLSYHLWATARRKKLDQLQEKFSSLYQGIVLDIGGRDRGRFKKPKDRVDQWIFADIEKQHEPDLVLDVTYMDQIQKESIDVVNAIELFEHVSEPEAGFKECARVLKPGGYFIVSMPFLFPIHADPYDYQRWTDQKLSMIISGLGLKIVEMEVTGYYFSVLSDMLFIPYKSLPNVIRKFLLPLKLLLAYLFETLDHRIDKNATSLLRKFPNGYFVVCQKPKTIK